MKNTNVKIAKKAPKPKAKPFVAPTDFDSHSDLTYFMESEGLFAGFNMPPALSSKDDLMHSLPPYRKRAFYPVDEFPGCPSNWVASRGRSRSYFVPVVEGDGMWLDFNKNDNNEYQVAVVVSIQGVNAITGLMTSDEHLEQYIENCPKHNEPFGPKRWCEKCGYHWPKQNYICTTGTPRGQFWLDGFRAADGAVRQYLLTAEKMRGVASNVIGEERVFAIGLSFFLSKNPKPKQSINTILRNSPSYGGGFIGSEWSDCWSTKFKSPDPLYTYCTSKGLNGIISTQKLSSEFPIDTSVEICSNTTEHQLFDSNISNNTSGPIAMACCSSLGGGTVGSAHSESGQILARGMVKAKNLEVGAGAKIRQQIYDDPESLDFWRDEASAIICVNYVLENDAIEIFKRGRLDLSGSPDGFLQGIPVGN